MMGNDLAARLRAMAEDEPTLIREKILFEAADALDRSAPAGITPPASVGEAISLRVHAQDGVPCNGCDECNPRRLEKVLAEAREQEREKVLGEAIQAVKALACGVQDCVNCENYADAADAIRILQGEKK